jgi:hypothetical protein
MSDDGFWNRYCTFSELMMDIASLKKQSRRRQVSTLTKIRRLGQRRLRLCWAGCMRIHRLKMLTTCTVKQCGLLTISVALRDGISLGNDVAVLSPVVRFAGLTVWRARSRDDWHFLVSIVNPR